MGKYICINCREKIKNETRTDNGWESSGSCEVCWKLREDSRWYGRHGLPIVADYLKAVLGAREVKSKRKE